MWIQCLSADNTSPAGYGYGPSATGESSYTPPPPPTKAEQEAYGKKQLVDLGGKLGDANNSKVLDAVFIGVAITTEAGNALAQFNSKQLNQLQNLLESNYSINSIKINDQLLKIRLTPNIRWDREFRQAKISDNL